MLPPEEHRDKKLHWIVITDRAPSSDWHSEVWEWRCINGAWVWITPSLERLSPTEVRETYVRRKCSCSYDKPVTRWVNSEWVGGIVFTGNVAAEINSRDAKIRELTAELDKLKG